jgi:hypothetical protein
LIPSKRASAFDFVPNLPTEQEEKEISCKQNQYSGAVEEERDSLRSGIKKSHMGMNQQFATAIEFLSVILPSEPQLDDR